MSTSLSLLASHDEVVRCTDVLVNGACEEGSDFTHLPPAIFSLFNVPSLSNVLKI